MDDLTRFKKTYFEECAELLADVEKRLLEMKSHGINDSDLNAVFRGIHSIKGGAGVFSFSALVGFSHIFETLLDLVRDGKIEVTPHVIDVCLRGNDTVSNFVAAAEEEKKLPDGFGQESKAEIEALIGQVQNVKAPSVTAPKLSSANLKKFEILFRPKSYLLLHGNEPLILVRELRRLGELQIFSQLGDVPPLEDLKAGEIFISWRFILETSSLETEVREVFEFVEDDCELAIREIKSASSDSKMPAKANDDAKFSAPMSSIRVELERVDRLVNMVGELVITQSMLRERISKLPIHHAQSLLQGLEDLTHHTRDLQESVMAIRAQPVRSVFSRMPRLVRELSATLKKEVRLETSGQDTEVDKTVIEQLADPLTHMIRNSVDHGIELPDERVARGKNREGLIRLSAMQRGGKIIIEVSDDGAGIDTDHILQKAIEKGLASAEDHLDPDQIRSFIFHPGFSTVETLSNVSGRGVGMDVVRQNIHGLGGRVYIESEVGQGAKFTLALPLTLAVLDGMVVSVGDEIYILPLTNIVESLRPKKQDIHKLVHNFEMIVMRGEYIPLIYLKDAFAIEGGIQDITKALVVLVEAEDGQKIGIVVDELLGQQQVVIKSLESNYRHVEGVSGATILGSGQVALILDAAGLSRKLSIVQKTKLAMKQIHQVA